MGLRVVLRLVLLCVSSVTAQSVMYELKSKQAELGPSQLPQPPDSILWKLNGNKVVEFTGSEEQVYGSFEGRVTLDWHTAKLQISDLHLEDSGKYEYEIFVLGKLLGSSYDLQVIENVSKPSITCQNISSSSSSSSSNQSAVLLCSVDPNRPQSPLMFEWSSEGNAHTGEALTIFLGGELDEWQYTCQVSNPVSHEAATFTARNCKTETGLSAGIVALIVIILIVCLGLVVLLYLLKKNGQVCFRKEQTGDVENPTSSEVPGPPKKSVGDDRTGTLEREATLPSSRPLAAFQGRKNQQSEEEKNGPPPGYEPRASSLERLKKQRNTKNGLHEVTRQDDETEPLLQDQPTATLPQLQNQVNAENANDGEAQKQQGPPKGHVKEKAERIEKMERDAEEQKCNIIRQKKTDSEQKPFQKEEKSPDLDEQAAPSSPPLGQLASTADDKHDSVVTELPGQSRDSKPDEMEDGSIQDLYSAPENSASVSEVGASQPDDGGGLHPVEEPSPLTQNSANLPPKDTDDEHAKDLYIVSKDDSSAQEKHNTLDHSNNELQTTTTPQRRGSETSEGGEEPNGSDQETHAKEEKKQESYLSSQENIDKSEEDQHKTNCGEPAKEVETTKNNNVVGEEEASSDGNKSSETSKDQNLSQAAVTKPEHDQPQTNHEDPGDEVKVTKSGDVMEEAGTSSEISPQEENLGDCNQNDEDTKPPITTEQESSEKNEDGKKPNSPLVKPEFSEDIKEPSPPTENSENLTAEDGDGEQDKHVNANTQPPTLNEDRGSDVSESQKEPKLSQENSADQQKTDSEESAKEAESTKKVPLVEEEEACGDMDDRSGEENSEDPNQDDENPQPPPTPEQWSLKATEEEKGPKLSLTETTESEQNQQKIDHEDWGGDENQATKKEKVLEEVKASSDVDDRSREENSDDPNQHDKDTKTPTVPEPQKTDTTQSAAEQREHHGGSEENSE